MQDVQRERTADCIFVHDGEVRPNRRPGASEIKSLLLPESIREAPIIVDSTNAYIPSQLRNRPAEDRKRSEKKARTEGLLPGELVACP